MGRQVCFSNALANSLGRLATTLREAFAYVRVLVFAVKRRQNDHTAGRRAAICEVRCSLHQQPFNGATRVGLFCQRSFGETSWSLLVGVDGLFEELFFIAEGPIDARRIELHGAPQISERRALIALLPKSALVVPRNSLARRSISRRTHRPSRQVRCFWSMAAPLSTGLDLGRILINRRQIGRKVIQTPQGSLPWPTDVMT
jgi:hypothetical protein